MQFAHSEDASECLDGSYVFPVLSGAGDSNVRV
jgi:hypothetical protein